VPLLALSFACLQADEGLAPDESNLCRSPPLLPSPLLLLPVLLPVLAPSFACLQADEGLAPDGSKMDNWLEEMLAEMQMSIEHHLKDVFK
jgi:hypothetical protein